MATVTLASTQSPRGSGISLLSTLPAYSAADVCAIPSGWRVTSTVIVTPLAAESREAALNRAHAVSQRTE